MVALRNLVRNKLYSLLNIIGLAIGIACCILIMLYVQDELSFDRFHDNADRIVRVSTHFQIKEREMNFATTAFVQGPMLKESFPEIENYSIFNRYRGRRIVQYKDKRFSEEKFLWAEASLFDVFTFKLLKGNPKDALLKPNSVVITQEMAKKYFGTENPVGKSLRVHNDTIYKVTGVVENIPHTSHFRPDFLASFSSLKLKPKGIPAEDMLNNVDYFTFLLLKPGADFKDLEQKIPSYIEKHLGAALGTLGGKMQMKLMPLTRIYLHSKLDGELERTGDITYLYLFSAIGIFILLLACLNFMNLSTARLAKRAREVGIRKVVGAQRRQLIIQFLGEAFILTLIAILMSILVAFLLMPTFQMVSGKHHLAFDLFSNLGLMVGLGLLLLLTSLFGGSYPAFFLSAFKPVDVIKGKLQGGMKSSALRVILVTFQFTISIILIIGTLVVQQQLNYIRAKKLGYNMDHMVSVTVRNEETRKKIQTLKYELLKHPSIRAGAASIGLPLGYNNYSAHHVEGKPQNEISMFYGQFVDEDFFDTYQIQMVEGRKFSKKFPNDVKESVIINEAAVKKLGWEGVAVGKIIERFRSLKERQPFRVVGVVRDYHFQSLRRTIEPLIIHNGLPFGGNFGLLSLQISPENIEQTMDYIRQTWKVFDPKYPFEYSFVNDRYDQLYRTEVLLGKLFGYFTLLAIIIGCLGLFGLTSFTTEQRTKEIGVRKVMGASVSGLVVLLIRDFVKWVILAMIFAWPVAYYLMNRWLNEFAYRTSLGPQVFVFSALLALTIAILTISYQAIRGALTNPANTLRQD